ncbi:hypothetical protein KUTeg_004034 [Tegillarca granosa]|uniref:Evolutionarily conserved signaling intermediate in Toll pathway, mitochondrial n=1 Tax=Tegillarca granosa TaxID=220873 RepID=A0ABQ9FTB6_TEGGR|nr:hypothetical protein KUTeg_004034 [Tegillarca granosa]
MKKKDGEVSQPFKLKKPLDTEINPRLTRIDKRDIPVVHTTTTAEKKLVRKASDIFDIASQEGKNLETFIKAVDMYNSIEKVYKRGMVEFIEEGLKRMNEFGLEKNLDAYKVLILVFPKEELKAQTGIQVGHIRICGVIRVIFPVVSVVLSELYFESYLWCYQSYISSRICGVIRVILSDRICGVIRVIFPVVSVVLSELYFQSYLWCYQSYISSRICGVIRVIFPVVSVVLSELYFQSYLWCYQSYISSRICGVIRVIFPVVSVVLSELYFQSYLWCYQSYISSRICGVIRVIFPVVSVVLSELYFQSYLWCYQSYISSRICGVIRVIFPVVSVVLSELYFQSYLWCYQSYISSRICGVIRVIFPVVSVVLSELYFQSYLWCYQSYISSRICGVIRVIFPSRICGVIRVIFPVVSVVLSELYFQSYLWCYQRLIPDEEFGHMLTDIFHVDSHCVHKYSRMMYWLPKFRHANPYPVPYILPDDDIELAVLALKRAAFDVNNKIDIWKTKDVEENPIEDTFIVSAQSLEQQELIEKHPVEQPLYVEGAHTVYLRNKSQSYFVLKADPKPEKPQPKKEVDEDLFENWRLFFEDEEPTDLAPLKSIHEQDDLTILGMCITGTGSKDSLVTWIRYLQQKNHKLEQIPIVFSLKPPVTVSR